MKIYEICFEDNNDGYALNRFHSCQKYFATSLKEAHEYLAEQGWQLCDGEQVDGDGTMYKKTVENAGYPVIFAEKNFTAHCFIHTLTVGK